MSDARYTRTAALLHWAMALLIVAAVAVGAWMTGLPSGITKLKVYAGNEHPHQAQKPEPLA